MSLSGSLNQTNVPLVARDIDSVSEIKSVNMNAQIYTSFLTVTNSAHTATGVNVVSFPHFSYVYDEWLNKPQDGIARVLVM